MNLCENFDHIFDHNNASLALYRWEQKHPPPGDSIPERERERERERDHTMNEVVHHEKQ